MTDINHTITQQWSNGGAILTQPFVASGNLEQNANVNMPANTQNVECDIAFNYQHLQSIFILTSQNMHIATNNAAGVQTFDVVGGEPFVWLSGSGIANPFNGSINKIFISNNTITNDVMQIRTLANTP